MKPAYQRAHITTTRDGIPRAPRGREELSPETAEPACRHRPEARDGFVVVDARNAWLLLDLRQQRGWRLPAGWGAAPAGSPWLLAHTGGRVWPAPAVKSAAKRA